MGFLRRLFGGGDATGTGTPEGGTGGGRASSDPSPAPPTAADMVAAEQARERELARADAERLADPLIQRQLRYADRAWTPPAQGGERRADDEDADAGEPRG